MLIIEQPCRRHLSACLSAERRPQEQHLAGQLSVRFLGAQSDVAVVTYYLTGRIELPDDQGTITDYRTRASEVMQKMDGKWVIAASHYSTLFGASGVRLE